MSLVRPEVSALLARWGETAAAFGLVAAGIWVTSLGGWVLYPAGVAIAAAGVGWAVVALRRLRFARAVEAPGIVGLDEGQVGYFGPVYGGVMALAELAELRIGQRDGQLEWRLRSRDGAMLRIPASALGAERLYDAFAVLPGVDMMMLTRALDAPPPEGGSRKVWERPGRESSPVLLPPPPVRGSDHHDLS